MEMGYISPKIETSPNGRCCFYSIFTYLLKYIFRKMLISHLFGKRVIYGRHFSQEIITVVTLIIDLSSLSPISSI